MKLSQGREMTLVIEIDDDSKGSLRSIGDLTTVCGACERLVIQEDYRVTEDDRRRRKLLKTVARRRRCTGALK